MRFRQGTGNREQGTARKGLKPLNLFMTRKKNTFFEMRSTRKNTSLYKSPNFNNGDFTVPSSLFPLNSYD